MGVFHVFKIVQMVSNRAKHYIFVLRPLLFPKEGVGHRFFKPLNVMKLSKSKA